MMCTDQLGELVGVPLSLIPPRAPREGDGHTRRALDKEGGLEHTGRELGTQRGSWTYREGAGPPGREWDSKESRAPSIAEDHQL